MLTIHSNLKDRLKIKNALYMLYKQQEQLCVHVSVCDTCTCTYIGIDKSF